MVGLTVVGCRYSHTVIMRESRLNHSAAVNSATALVSLIVGQRRGVAGRNVGLANRFFDGKITI
jgi:hypothetical protein